MPLSPPLPWAEMVAVFSAVAVAYVIFGIAGFGTALIASPILANFMPVSHIVPLLALLDMFAALSHIAKDGRHADTSELKRLAPFMVIGSVIGVAILLKTRPDFLLLALAVFVIGYALYALSGFRARQSFAASAAKPFGLIGGVFSALFGSGGFIYALYLSGRIEQKEKFRVTQSTLIGLSTLTRVVFFTISGVYMNTAIWTMALILAPAMIFGVFLGRHITLRLTREQFMRVIHMVVLCSGVFLLMRYFNL
ncbi:sulfite exporter TauE/SafE family protein [Allofranklinella schreckenbergeri]|nr:sulfite exporter TauE/SafE family protein [Allofranklinella schreckenbergeri]